MLIDLTKSNLHYTIINGIMNGPKLHHIFTSGFWAKVLWILNKSIGGVKLI